MYGCEIEALVEYAGLGRSIAEEDHRERDAVLQHGAERRADADRDRAAHDRHAAEEIDREVDEMHRAAFARGATGSLAVELGEHRAQIAALAAVVGVRTMRTDDVVLELQVPAHARGHRFLADAEMGGAAHVALRVKRSDALLDAADFQHRAIEREPRLARQGGRLIA